ncbi:DJ-1 family glyoxalase III [Motilimonas pumila]|uniref:DJ-1 family protein n=1 Tax=Motilimonas pumila TaxID=2303987 RepID=A0A418YKQ1_9GAMM|nr:DJ-1 family glyoxalase III [Motilimonas pumila]RJG51536.1 DJ-1 family protein [Motilimonas pumila]
MSATVLVAIASGSEELETVTIVNVLRRADMEVELVSCEVAPQLTIRCARGMNLVADKHISEISTQAYAAIVLPGGMPGAANLGQCQPLVALLKQQQAKRQWLGAICAAPAQVLAKNDLILAAKVTGYPSFQDQLPAAQLQQDSVVVDAQHKLITSQGPATALEFALHLVEQLVGSERRQQVADAMLVTASEA